MEELTYEYRYDKDEIIKGWEEENDYEELNEEGIINEFIDLLLRRVYASINTTFANYDRLKIIITKKGYSKYGELKDFNVSEHNYDINDMRNIVDIEHVNMNDFKIDSLD